MTLLSSPPRHSSIGRELVAQFEHNPQSSTGDSRQTSIFALAFLKGYRLWVVVVLRIFGLSFFCLCWRLGLSPNGAVSCESARCASPKASQLPGATPSAERIRPSAHPPQANPPFLRELPSANHFLIVCEMVSYSAVVDGMASFVAAWVRSLRCRPLCGISLQSLPLALPQSKDLRQSQNHLRWLDAMGARAQQKPVCFDSLVPCHHASARADLIGQGKSECCFPTRTRIASRFLVYDPCLVRTNAMTTCPSCHSVHCAALDQDQWVEKRTRMCPHQHGMV